MDDDTLIEKAWQRIENANLQNDIPYHVIENMVIEVAEQARASAIDDVEKELKHMFSDWDDNEGEKTDSWIASIDDMKKALVAARNKKKED